MITLKILIISSDLPYFLEDKLYVGLSNACADLTKRSEYDYNLKVWRMEVEHEKFIDTLKIISDYGTKNRVYLKVRSYSKQRPPADCENLFTLGKIYYFSKLYMGSIEEAQEYRQNQIEAAKRKLKIHFTPKTILFRQTRC